MTGRDKKSDADAIREIIEAEEAKALVRFRSSRFGERLKKSLAEQAARPFRPARVCPALRPVWISLAALIVLAAAAAWLLRPRPRVMHGGAFFHGLPGLQAIENPPLPFTSAPSLPGSLTEKDIAFVLSGPLGSDGRRDPEQSRGVSDIKPGPEALGLERVYEILIIDKSVERVLADISLKTKEG